MSVLICPVCKGAMKEVSKSSVLVDTCTQCRGVWLDRGELEKLAAAVGETEQRTFLGGALPPQREPQHRRDDDDDDGDKRRGRGQPTQRRRSFLDFFD